MVESCNFKKQITAFLQEYIRSILGKHVYEEFKQEFILGDKLYFIKSHSV